MTTLDLGNEQQAVQPERRLVAGRYRLRARIGRGRLGDIYGAEDEGYSELGVGGRVALQLLPDRIALDHGLFSKLKLGYTVLRAGSHPNIVPYLDIDYDGKFGYLVMEALDGASLRFVLDDVTSLPLEEALPVVRGIGDALQFLHAKSMVHGQLTAENVFITENLEVRLLDVVPLDSASTILRGVASRDPFSRADIGDDIYALACLTYEILAGRHPFNFHPAVEASGAGLEPARIPSLPERPWKAIRRGLSFEREERHANVQEFLDDLGVTGTERLRSSTSGSTERAAERKPVQRDVPPIKRPASARRDEAEPARVESPLIAAPAPGEDKRRAILRARRKRASRVRSFFLLLVLAGLAGWYYYGQPRDDIAKLVARVDSYRAPASPAAVSRKPQVAVVQELDTTEPVAPAAMNAPQDTAPQPDAEPLPAAAGREAAADIDAETVAVADSGYGSESKSPGDTLIQSFVTVYERDGAARIAFRRPVGTAGTIVWWTADGTAIAESDYIPLETPVVAFASGEEAETLHVPLINDGLPESRETFFVFLGQRNPASGQLQPIARVRVDINDDD